MNEPDSRLLERFVRTNDALAFDQLARRYRGMVFATARRVTGNHHDAEDVAQGCFFELAQRAGSMRIPVAAYLHSTATHRSIDLLREHSRRKKHEEVAASERTEQAKDANPAERTWEELSPEVDQAIEALPEELRVPIILYYLRGLTDKDIAHELGIKRNTVMSRLQVGVRRLRAGLSKNGAGVPLGVLAVGLKASSSIAVPATLTAATGRMALIAGFNRPPISRWQAWRGAAGASASRLLLLLMPRVWIGTALLGLIASSIFFFGWRNTPSPGPYDRLSQLYSPYLLNDPSPGFAWHTSSMQSDLSSFWRGSQPLFFQWCKSNCQDWLSKKNNYVLCQASPNLEDAERPLDEINTDNSARLPVEIELLQGLVTVRLAANVGFTGPTDRSSYEVAQTLCTAYRESLLKDTSLGAAPNSHAGTLDEDRSEVQEFIDPNTNDFRPLVLRRGKIDQFLRPSRLSCDQATAMIASALTHNPSLSSFLGTTAPRVQSIRAQVRYGSVVTQGQSAFLVMLEGSTYERPLILELKQQTPSPAELSGAVPRDSRNPAQRATDDARRLGGSNAFPGGWCVYENESYTVGPFVPEKLLFELRKDRWIDPFDAARIWAASIAATHRADPHRAELASRITSMLPNQLAARCDDYVHAMNLDFISFGNDPRLGHDRMVEAASITTWLDQIRADTTRQSR